MLNLTLLSQNFKLFLEQYGNPTMIIFAVILAVSLTAVCFLVESMEQNEKKQKNGVALNVTAVEGMPESAEQEDLGAINAWCKQNMKWRTKIQMFFYELLNGSQTFPVTAVEDNPNNEDCQSGAKSILLSRPILFLLIVANYSLFWTLQMGKMSMILSTIYALGIALSQSDFMERVFRIFEDARDVATNTETNRLMGIFNAVKDRAIKYGGLIDNKVKLYIVDSMEINSFVIGKRTIVITRGLMYTMNDEEIEAVIAHEMAHIINGDGQASMFVAIASNICIWCIALLILVLKFLENVTGRLSFISELISFVRVLLEAILKYVLLLLNILLASCSRAREYKADTVACRLGYGEGLLSALGIFYDIEVSSKKQFLDRWQASHPRTAYRIRALEKLYTPS